MDTYRGYEISQAHGEYVWTDEKGHAHTGKNADNIIGFRTAEAAMDDIDAYRRKLRETAQ